MPDSPGQPQTLDQAIAYFADEGRAFEFLKQARWPSGVVACPRCGCEGVSFISTRTLWTCKQCNRNVQFTIRTGTILQNSALALGKWVCCFWLFASTKKGVTSAQIHGVLRVPQKTGWRMQHSILLSIRKPDLAQNSPNANPQTPFSRTFEFATRILSVRKSEIDQRKLKWRKKRIKMVVKSNRLSQSASKFPSAD